MSESESPIAVSNAATAATPEPVEKPTKDVIGSSTPPVARRSPGAAGTMTARRSGVGITNTASKSTAALSARAPGGMSKPPTRPPASTVRRPTTSASTSSHQSQPSVSASEDEKKSAAKSTTTSATPRRVSSIKSSPGSLTDKKAGAPTTSAVRKSATAISTAASPRTSGIVARPGIATTSTTGTRAAVTRPGSTTSSSTVDARKRLSAVSLSPSTPRPSTRNSLRSEVPADTAKEIEELTSRLTEKDGEIESLRSQIATFEQTIAELREQADHVVTGEIEKEEKSNQEHQEAIAHLTTEHQLAVESWEAKISEVADKLQTAENDLIEALRIKDEREQALEALKSSLEMLKVENEGKLRASEENLQKVLCDRAAQVEELQVLAADRKESENALAELNASHESAIVDLKLRIEELTVSNSALETSNKSAIESERNAHTSVAALEAELSQLKVNLVASEKAVEKIRAQTEDEQGLSGKLQSSLNEREAELASSRENMAMIQNEVNELQLKLADKEGDISKLKEMHDERLKQISQDYENEIESLRGDAFFKRKFEELEKQHDELKASAAETTENHAKEVASSKEEHLAAVGHLESKILEYQQDLNSLRANHAGEMEALKNASSTLKEAHAKELDSLKSHYAEALQLMTRDGEATLAKCVEDLKISHEEAFQDLERKYADERENLLISHKSELVAIKDVSDNVLTEKLAKLQAQLDETKTELDEARSSNAEELITAKHELIENHVSEVDKLITMHTEAMESLKAEGANAKKDLEELAATHTKAIEGVMAEYRNNTISFEEKLSEQAVANVELQAALKQAQEAYDDAQNEARDLSRQLAQEKMERMTVLAELDAAKTTKPDTSMIDALKSELVTAQKLLEESLSSSKLITQAKDDELSVAKNNLKAMNDKFVLVNQDLEFARKSLEAFKADAELKQRTAEADYNDLNESMTSLIEEANSKTRLLEIQVDELTKKVENGQAREIDLGKKAEELQRREEELLAQLKVRDAELAEEKAKAATVKPRGLASSRFASIDENGDDAAATGPAAEGEEDDDHSSAALALVREPLA